MNGFPHVLEIRRKEERFIVLCLTWDKYRIKEGEFKSPQKPGKGQGSASGPSAAAAGLGRGYRGRERGEVAEDFACGGMMQGDMSHHEGWSRGPLWNEPGAGGMLE